ncbi:MAG: hypothetical protein MJZ35_01165 [Bacteroidaceae bacterium]|nr:hypothetical protein [Bacteroidaceae bacterium]
MIRKIANVVCVVELALFILVPLIAWVASVLGADVVNLVSEEALRWLFNHGAEMLSSPHLSLLILFLTAIGTLQESKLAHHIRILVIRNEAEPPHRKALIGSLLFFFTFLIILFLPVIFRFTALLSVTGTLLPASPWLSGFPLALFVDIILTSIIYVAFSSQLYGIEGITRMITQGFVRHGVWIAIVMMGGLLYHIIKYCIS